MQKILGFAEHKCSKLYFYPSMWNLANVSNCAPETLKMMTQIEELQLAQLAKGQGWD